MKKKILFGLIGLLIAGFTANFINESASAKQAVQKKYSKQAEDCTGSEGSCAEGDPPPAQ